MDNEILVRFFNNQCTREEMRQIDEWLASEPDNARYFFEMERIWSLRNFIHYSGKQQIESDYNKLLPHLNRKYRNRRLTIIMRYAAIFVLFVSIFTYLYIAAPWQDSPGLNLIEVPRGEMASVTLSDGTKVWLNADTRFTYPDRFGSGKREVTLDGEAFFDVSTDKNKPFIVKGEKFNIKVLGTEFNVRSHKNEDAEVSLKTGLVQVVDAANSNNKLIIEPNQQIRYSVEGKKTFSTTDMSSVDSWRNGGISFISQPLSVIAKSLERKYNVKITIVDKQLADEVFTCRARSGATMDQVLKLLTDTRLIQYGYDKDNQILITKM